MDEKEDKAVKNLIKIGHIKQKYCNNEKHGCDNVKCVVKSRKRKADAKNTIISWRCTNSKCQTYYSLYAG
jgi:hypothetical protein